MSSSRKRRAAPRLPMEDSLEAMLRTDAIRSVFQPIVALDTSTVVGYEALARGPIGSQLEHPDELFTAARREGCVSRLDLACHIAALVGGLSAGMRFPWTLFVNIEPTTAFLGKPLAAVSNGPAPILVGGATPHQVVMELTERALTARPAALLRLVAEIRARGWGVAIDDMGAEPPSLALLPIVQPDVIKLDLSLVQQQPSAQVARILSAVNAEAERSGTAVLAEGIETEAHLALARTLGATLGQGWLLGRPGPLPVELPALTRPLHIRRGRGADPGQTPYEIVSAVRVPRTARKRLLIEISKHLERRALESGESTVVMSTFQEARFFTARARGRYTDLASRSAIVGVLGSGMPPAPAPGVRGADVAAGDRLLGEWDITVVGPHFAATLVARDLGDTGPDDERRFSFVLSHDRELAIPAATALMTRMPPEPTPPSQYGA